MATIAGRRGLDIALAGHRREAIDLFKGVAEQSGAVLVRYAGADGLIPDGAEKYVIRDIGKIVERTFVGPDGRTAYDGTRDLSPYARLLNKWIASAVEAVVVGHARYLKRTMPPDVWQWLAHSRVRIQEQGGGDGQNPTEPIGPLGPLSPPQRGTSSLSAARRAFLEKVARLRLFRPNPLAQYDAPHTWVDPRGYRLSDRLWDVETRTRRQIDMLLLDGIRSGRSALSMARELEQYLRPDQRLARTNMPYGVDVSYHAMRLARSEITRAHSEAALVAGRQNPYVTGMDWGLSNRHPKFDICDGLATLGMGGERLKEPYPIDGYVPIPVSDTHPMCLCTVSPAVTSSPAEVTADLREAMVESRRLLVEPYLTPVQAQDFLIGLLGRYIAESFIGAVGV